MAYHQYDYEWQIEYGIVKQEYTWVNGPNFTTLADCPNVGNLAVTTPNSTKATFTWDNSNGAYSFVRLQGESRYYWLKSFFNIGGVGVQYGTYTKNKNGLVPRNYIELSQGHGVIQMEEHIRHHRGHHSYTSLCQVQLD